MTITKDIKGIKTTASTTRISANRYNYVAVAFLRPSPITTIGYRRTATEAICEGFNRLSVSIRQVEEM